MELSSSELRRDSRSVCLRLLSQVAWRFTVWFNLEMIQKRVLKIRYERSSILMKSHLDVSVPVIMVLDFESGLRLVRRLIVNRSVEGSFLFLTTSPYPLLSEGEYLKLVSPPARGETAKPWGAL